MRVALIVEYEGTEYGGFQRQANAPSIQEELEKAIGGLTGVRSRVMGAGRTDAGVHAEAQVVAFDTEAAFGPATFAAGINFYLPGDIAVKAAYRTGDDFDPRRMALSRRYRYNIDCEPTRSPLTRRTAYHYAKPLDVRKMRRAAMEFVGAHDFAWFAGPLSRPGASTVREVYEARIRRRGDVISLEVEGNSFMPHQVRRMAGALLEVGRGRLEVEGLRSMVGGVSGALAARALPARGLCLVKVRYASFPPEVGSVDGNARKTLSDTVV
jgi:tRNA pseudouridine38-40 synthase